ncbi:hypothetical protein WICPIJ_007044 [Wickerhamomyces pijperi]|uniref:Uncharacterized protein n=1 Tax=Wickerhamomyces pijperi TaxID=599730 RepID=A0A9P8Q0K7_WICPI|nr:hypothetical protein WICPIJ_007044 [Wickerhamomyces pijperi]
MTINNQLQTPPATPVKTYPLFNHLQYKSDIPTKPPTAPVPVLSKQLQPSPFIIPNANETDKLTEFERITVEYQNRLNVLHIAELEMENLRLKELVQQREFELKKVNDVIEEVIVSLEKTL